jgi:hypothetical protein
MRRREDRALSKHTINLYHGDYAKIQNLYPARIGAAKVIRDVLHAHILGIEKNARKLLVYDDELDLVLNTATNRDNDDAR